MNYRVGLGGLLLLLPLWGGITPPVWAETRQCLQIREVRNLAILNGLDDHTLVRLEALYCGRTSRRTTRTRRSLPQYNEECEALRIMTTLATIGDGNTPLTRMVESEQQVSCGFSGRRNGNWTYPNGQAVHFGSNWYYPNGERAKFGSNWNYPNGERANFGTNWNYPNGERANFGSNWYKPDGTRVSVEEFLSWGCNAVSRSDCNRLVQLVQSPDRVQRNLALLELGWKAHNRGF
ncbi:hypothetical protein PN462_02335 [Spirulina sp. CS-785/01]|uniref:hypothetical protein n=1 Tax=Spirulina sp. CS-785/01 TaxID=3021716 RepID=UPI00232DB3C3|nr:hypothetical protein [Spirulina sp. CS-785/01]MDB9311925.1 hypothetical protein [Spirulina sp. CS-785/01]